MDYCATLFYLLSMKEISVHKGVVHLLESVNELKVYLERLEDDSMLTFDWETTGLEYNSIPLGMSIHQEGLPACFVPIDYMFSKGIPMNEVADVCNKEFKRLRLIAHNAKFDSMINVMNGIKDESCNIVADTLIMIHLYDPVLEMQLEKRVSIDFGYSKKTFDEIIGKSWDKVNWNIEGDELLPLLAGYSGEDAYWETQMYNKYSKLLDEDAWNILNKIEMPLVGILRDAKIRGVKIDVPLLSQMNEKAKLSLVEYRNRIYDLAGCVFNINSAKQKREVFFDKLNLPVISKTKSGGDGTDVKSAAMWAEMGYPIGEALIAYSELQKLISGYLKPIPEWVDDECVLRGDINSCGTKTGRCSSSRPNLQNQPNNHDFPVRSAFIPRPGYVLINYDYSQLEMRILAHMSKDEKLIDMFMHNRDPHGEVAKEVGITRKQAKVLNFGVIYGMGPDTYARTFKVTKEKAIAMVDNYHRAYPGFASWKTHTENYAKKNGYVKNLFGRIRRFTEVTKNPRSDINKALYFGELRRAVNTIVQGTGADIVKLATIAMCRKFKEMNLDAHFLLQVHDEVLVEANIAQMMQIEEVVIDSMQNTIELCIPLLVDGKNIINWGEMKDENVISLPKRFDYSLYSGIL